MRLAIILLCLGWFTCEAVIPLDFEKNLEWVSAIFRGYPTDERPMKSSKTIRQDCPSCQCGIPKTTRRIVGGTESVSQKYPWMALMMFRGVGFCGGSLISDQHVLCAAHCTVVPKENVTIRLLEHDTTSDEEEVLNMKVMEIISHPDYTKKTMDNDIAIYKLEKKLDISEKRIVSLDNRQLSDVTLRTICMPPKDQTFVGKEGLVTGWGHIKQGGPASTFLREVTVPIISQEECQKGYRKKITENMLCAGYEKGGKDSCQGDSGGPLHIIDETTNKYQQVGVVSFGAGCARPKRPGVYASVNKYLDWIAENTADSCRCEG